MTMFEDCCWPTFPPCFGEKDPFQGRLRTATDLMAQSAVKGGCQNRDIVPTIENSAEETQWGGRLYFEVCQIVIFHFSSRIHAARCLKYFCV